MHYPERNPLADLYHTSCLVITGKAGAGKDTLARMMQEYMFGTAPRRGLVPLKFSKALKEVVSIAFGWDEALLDHLGYKEDPLDRSMGGMNTRREILQYLGTDVFRKLDEDVWVKAALRRAAGETFDPKVGFVCTDCRFPNEWEALHRHFRTIHTVRVERLSGRTMFDWAARHASEQHRFECKMTVSVLEGDMEAMREYARLACHQFYPELLKENEA